MSKEIPGVDFCESCPKRTYPTLQMAWLIIAKAKRHGAKRLNIHPGCTRGWHLTHRRVSDLRMARWYTCL